MEKIEANRNFANKLWNSCKFVTGNALKDVDEAEMALLAVNGPIQKEEFEKLRASPKTLKSIS
jgi:valyl-tRNA synthetase